MAYINDLFKIIITETANSWITDWADEYMNFTEDIKKIKLKIQTNPGIDITDAHLYNDLITVNTYHDFVKKLIYDRNNGVSSRGRSILSKINLEIAQNNAELKVLLKQIILDPSSANFELFEKWWFKTFNINNPVLINRAYSACAPYKFTSTVDNGKFWHVVNFLKTECDFIFPHSGNNWVDYNEMITPWIDEQLTHELSVYKTQKEKNAWRNIFYWLLYEFDPSEFEFKKQLVKYGAPGTGKTYTCKQGINNHFSIWKSLHHKTYTEEIASHLTIVQFHPAYTYEDFMEGIRPIVNDGKTELKLANGIFKNCCKKAAEWEFDVYTQIPEMKEKQWNTIVISDVIDVLEGEKWEFLKEIKNPETTLLDKAIPPYYIIIDEINRAELSRVLGELMYCLEYRGYEGKIKTQYSSMVDGTDEETVYWFEDGENFFFIPNNIYIMGTMNNIDRSVESFDFALRRRFQWIEVEPNYDIIINDKLPEGLEAMVNSLFNLNMKIENDPLLGKDYRIGHAYFMKRPAFMDKLSLKDCKEFIWLQSIKPLLEEYLRGSGEDSRMAEFSNIFMA